MRTREQIYSMIEKFKEKNTDNGNAIITVLENYIDGEEMDDMDIERTFFDEDNPWLEQSALRAMEWLNEEITDEELF